MKNDMYLLKENKINNFKRDLSLGLQKMSLK